MWQSVGWWASTFRGLHSNSDSPSRGKLQQRDLAASSNSCPAPNLSFQPTVKRQIFRWCRPGPTKARLAHYVSIQTRFLTQGTSSGDFNRHRDQQDFVSIPWGFKRQTRIPVGVCRPKLKRPYAHIHVDGFAIEGSGGLGGGFTSITTVASGVDEGNTMVIPLLLQTTQTWYSMMIGSPGGETRKHKCAYKRLKSNLQGSWFPDNQYLCISIEYRYWYNKNATHKKVWSMQTFAVRKCLQVPTFWQCFIIVFYSFKNVQWWWLVILKPICDLE